MKTKYYTFTTGQFEKLISLAWSLGLRAGGLSRSSANFRKLVEETYKIKEEPFKHLK